MQNEATGQLSDGGTFRVTSYMVELSDPNGAVYSTIDVNDLKEISRSGQEITLKRHKGGSVKISTASLDDAGILESTLRSGMSQAAAPAKGGGIGRFLKWGCLSTIGLIVVIVIIVIATSGGGDDSNQSVAAQASQSSNQVATSTEAVNSTVEAGNSTVAASSTGARLTAGQTAKIGDAEVTFNKARILNNDLIKADAGKQYIACEFKVVNTGTDEYNLSTLLQFEMLDSDSRKYTITINPDSNGTLDGTIPVAGSVLGEVVFEVPVDKAPYVVRFTKALGSDLAEWTVPQP